MSALKYWLWLTTRRGMSPMGSLRVLEHFGTPEGAYFADPAEYELVEGISRPARDSLREKSLEEADRLLGECDRLGIRVLTLQDADYPDRLKNIDDPPAVLYWKGRNIAFDEEAAIAVVGTRSPTPYGEKMAGRLGEELARHGALLVSGIAQGLDSCAIRGALKGGGAVVSLLASGIDVIYPRVNRFLYEDVAAAGALISEYPPGTMVKREHFDPRNRIISGLCLGVVAVECAPSSGTMLTIRHALEQNRDVFAVPGNVDAPMSMGTNRLIQEGAGLVGCGWDILREYESFFPGKIREVIPPPLAGESVPPEGAESEGNAEAVPISQEKPVDKAPERAYIDLSAQPELFTDDQRELLLTLGERCLPCDDLVELTQIPTKRVLSALTILQVLGYVAERPGKRFESLVRVNDA